MVGIIISAIAYAMIIKRGKRLKAQTSVPTMPEVADLSYEAYCLGRTIDQHIQDKNEKSYKQKRKENISKKRKPVKGYEFSNGGLHFTVF